MEDYTLSHLLELKSLLRIFAMNLSRLLYMTQKCAGHVPISGYKQGIIFI